MGNMNFICCVFLSACLCIGSVWGAVGTSSVNCAAGSDHNVGSVQEGYEGDVEILNNIQPSDNLQLEAYIFPIGISFLELIYAPGDTTAIVRTTKPLDADVLSQGGGTLYYSVACTNSGFKNKRELFVQDINDNAPVFENKLYSTSVSEVRAVGSDVLRVKAVDADVSPENNRVFYSIQPPVPAEFEIRSDGTIRIISRLNYNSVSLYNFTVEARDAGNLKDTASAVITVEDFDNMNPYFDHSLYQASIPENQVGFFSTVIPEAIKAQDGDTGINQPVIYSIITVSPNEYQSDFNINPNTGVISVTKALDREEVEGISLQIQAAQEDDSTKTAAAVVFLTIEDENDNPPEFDKTEYAAVIPENSPEDLYVLQAKVTDLDQGGFVGTLRLIPDTVPFSISPDGFIRVKTPAELDRETVSDFSFQIEARDDPPSTHSTTALVNITLSDENDNTPVFGSTKYEGEIPIDQTVGMLVVQVQATDLDEGPNGQISYSITFGNEKDYFDINKNTGEITLKKIVPLLENEILQFSLYVTAEDEGVISRSSSVIVDIKAPGDSHPQFIQKIYQGKVEEEQEPGAEIVKVAFLSLSPVVPVTLTLDTEADKFSIDQLTGILTTNIKLDYETQKNYTVRVSISDGTSRDEASVHVEVLDINDNSPVFEPSLISVTIPENIGTEENVTLVSATDADSGLNAEIRYTLEGSAGMFSIDPETGLITVAAALDRETKEKYELTVVGQDLGRPPLSAKASVVVTLSDVNDNAPVFTKQQYETLVTENTTIGTEVISVSATDKDEGPNGNVTYHIVKQVPHTEPAVFFVDASSGAVSLAQKLDYGQAKRYTLQVEGRDGGIPSLTGSTVVIVWVEDVKDKPPKFSEDQYDVGVYENIAPGSPLVWLEVTDEDEGGFSNGHFLLDSDVFSINSAGVIYLLSNCSLDRETVDHYMIEVVAVDQPVDGLSSTARVNVTVLDVNDNNPQFHEIENLFMIPENRRGEVTKIKVSDPDFGRNGHVSLTAYSQGDLFGFTMDGTMFLREELDRETQENYDVFILAIDDGLPQRHNFTNLKIIVTDVNDNPPVFSQHLYSTRILIKDVKKGDLVLTVTATDQDAGNNSLITYRFSSGSDLVDLDPETGAITWSPDLPDLIKDMEIELMVIAEDHGSPPLNDTATVLIELRSDSLSDGLVFRNSTYYFSVKENEPAETVVGEVQAIPGSGEIEVSYQLISHTDLFSLDKKGLIRTLKSLDKEEEEKYVLKVEATDSRSPPNTAVAMVLVEVEDVNESPEFTSKQYTVELFSISPFRFPVVTVKASDPDVGDGEELSYTLQESSSLLGVESSSGLVYVLDVTELGGMMITTRVKATDKLGLSASAEIQVHVKHSSSENVVVITLNQPVHTIERKISETQESLEKILGWRVNIISVRAVTQAQMFTLVRETSARTYISFIAEDTTSGAVSAEEVLKKLESESESVKAELEKVFGSEVELEKVDDRKSGGSDDTAALVLGLLLAFSLIALIVVLVVGVVKIKKMKGTSPDKERIIIEQQRREVLTNEDTNEDVFKTHEERQNHSSISRASDIFKKETRSVQVDDSDKVTSAL